MLASPNIQNEKGGCIPPHVIQTESSSSTSNYSIGTEPEQDNDSGITPAVIGDIIDGMACKLAALNYAKSGIPVFPCNPDNKRPMTEHGFKDATTDCEAIEDWGDWSDSLIGIPMGKASGLFVLDIDVKGKANGFDSLATLESQCGALPPTLTVKTPSGGEHRYFVMPETDPPLSISTGKLGAGLDTRGEGGYVIAPPSVNTEGKAYQFVDQDIDPVELPQWVIALLEKPKSCVKQVPPLSFNVSDSSPYGKVALNGIVAEMAAASKGQRNDTLNRLAFRVGVLVRKGEIDRSDIRALFQAAVSTGLSVEEARRTLNSGFEAGLESPATEAPVKTKTKKKACADEIIIHRAADMPVMPIDWIWPGWLPKGKLTILAGKGGTGKTTLALSIAATITTGGNFPDGSTCEPGNILVWSGEDAPEDTLIPRLKASGADLEKCYFIEGAVVDGEHQPFDPATDIPKLENAIEKIGNVALLIIDPVVNAVQGDMNKANEVRRGLQPLVDFGTRNNCAVLGITHFKKGSAGSHAAERVIGSQAFGALARMVLVAAQEEGKERRVLARGKSNIAPDHGGFEYFLRQTAIDTEGDPIDTTYAVWGNPIEGTANEILENVEREKKGSTLGAAVDFLRDLLSDGELLVNEIMSAATNEGYSSRTIIRAKEKLKIIPRKVGFPGTWYWAMPNTAEM